jgi:two-component system chemotaxis sensor kinase CheA
MDSGSPRERFVQLFAQEAVLRLDRLAAGILELESSADRPQVIAALLRETHTFKGEAAVVGLSGVQAVAHAFETTVEPLRSKGAAPPAEVIDQLLRVVDGLREVVSAAAQGVDDPHRVGSLLASLGADNPRVPVEGEVSPVAPVAEVLPPPVATAVSVPSGSELIELPAERIDDIVRSVGESATAHLRLGLRLGDDPERVTEFRELGRSIRDVHERAVRARMVPVASITGRLHRAVRDVARAGGKQVTWRVQGEDTELDRSVLQQLADPLLHMVRNAVDHGIEVPEERLAAGKPADATVLLTVVQGSSELLITLRDDGRGIDVERLRREAEHRGLPANLSDDELRELIFVGGVSTAATLSETSGRGVGLDVVRAKIESLRGRVEVRSTAGQGTEFRITVPSAAAVLPCLIVTAGGSRVAVPMFAVLSTQGATASTVVRAQGGRSVWVGDTIVPLDSLARLLGFADGDDGPLIVVAHGDRRAALQVGALLGQRDVMVKSLGPFVPVLPVVSGAAIEADGTILMVLAADALLAGAGGRAAVDDTPTDLAPIGRATAPKILVADDALAVRELERSILEQAGYIVVTASDGSNALEQLTADPVDLVLTDVEMPGMNGFELTRAIRADPALQRIPVLIVSSKNTAADHQAGMDAGADGYIVKSSFGEGALLATVERLLGSAA